MSKKTNYSYVGIAFIMLVFGIIFIPKIIDRMSKGDVTRDESRSEEVSVNAGKKASDLAYIPLSEENRKVPAFSFTDQHGNTITNEDYLGKVYVVEFFFTTCPTICPRMNRNLVDIQDEFKAFENFGIASFTINPDYDTQDVLKAYAEKYGVINPNWHFMTGKEEDIYNLANIGFNIYAGKNAEAEGGFEHSGNFALIDKEGYIRSRKDAHGNPMIYYIGVISEAEGEEDGQKEQISILKEDIAKLLKE
ncbi:MAG: SCO family protein [Bacteroidota bacterium]